MNSRLGKAVKIIIIAFVLVFTILPLQGLAADPSNVIYSSVTPRTVSYKGSENPGYITVHIKTDKPARGHIDDTVIGSITLGEDAKMDVWISNRAGVHINHVMPTENLTRPVFII